MTNASLRGLWPWTQDDVDCFSMWIVLLVMQSTIDASSTNSLSATQNTKKKISNKEQNKQFEIN